MIPEGKFFNLRCVPAKSEEIEFEISDDAGGAFQRVLTPTQAIKLAKQLFRVAMAVRIHRGENAEELLNDVAPQLFQAFTPGSIESGD